MEREFAGAAVPYGTAIALQHAQHRPVACIILGDEPMLAASELAGFIASSLVLLTFAMKDMRLLRITAIFSNVAFIAYGTLHWLAPIIALHVLLLPINIFHLFFRAAGERLPAETNNVAATKAKQLAVQAIEQSIVTRSKPRLASRPLRVASETSEYARTRPS